MKEKYDKTKYDTLSWACYCADTFQLLFVHRELGGAQSVAVSPSGRDVYVASSNPGSLTHFCADSTTGELVAIESIMILVTDTQSRLDGASSVAVDPNNNHLYVASAANGALWVLDISDETDEEGCALLEWQDTISNSVGHIDGLESARGIAVSPDGRTTIVVGQSTGPLVVFRDTSGLDTPAPSPGGNDDTSPIDSDKGFDYLAGEIIGSVVVGTLALVALIVECAGDKIWPLLVVRRKQKIPCPRCKHSVKVREKNRTRKTYHIQK